ncbi:(2Fe-2S) ferredoxin domain-containing protein [Legionella hackeliae]|uniref:Putative ferredoxin 2fe-2s protein n=2 Tax=Legionella hackeliae TaxID=449 RepID=A0A0A8UW41_LEGHA|nr:(2Fe-2S) ferredoxin domain-containing protein [Legionella hackeliae]KTD09958.1 (2Fe-2S) ferredoxin [Legionella hackeliae]CEK11741.1 putative ferredoxin 2fe-2s protein [Legionella hackeliae]STX48511.1 (2Fe-2S) ferredoxin [Legionella hackeliae]
MAGKQCCANTGGEPFFEHMKARLLELDLHGPGKIRISKSGCLGRCSEGPCVVIYPEGIWYTYATMADIDEIIDSHLVAGNTVEHLLIPG